MSNSQFDTEEQAILGTLVEEVEPVTVEEDQPGGDATPAAEEAKPAGPEAVQAEETPAPAEPAPPQGDTRAALRASRRAEKRLRDELEQIRSENEALKQGKAPVDTLITDAELARASKQPTQAEFVPPSYHPEIQDVIDDVPDLLAWQHDPAQQDKFKRAVQYDKALEVDPDWRGKPLSERFTEAVRRTKAALNPSSAAPAEPATPVAPKKTPAAVIAAAPVKGPKGISDFRGGAPANAQTVNYAGMSDEQIMASLPMA